MSKDNSEKRISIPDLVQLLLNLKWWIALATFVAVFITYIALKFIEPRYKQESWIMLNNTESSRAEIEFLSDLSGISNVSSLENEVFIMKSPSMMRKVVERLGLNYRYFHFESPLFKGKTLPLSGTEFADHLPSFYMKRVEFYEDTPFIMSVFQNELLPEKMQTSVLTVMFEHLDADRFIIKEVSCNGEKLGYHSEGYHYGKRISAGKISFMIEPKLLQDMKTGVTYMCSWTKPIITAGYFSTRLSAARANANKGDIVILSYEDNCLNRAKNILNTLVSITNSESKEYSTLAQKKTIAFIDARLETLSKELNDAENDFKTYQSSNVVLNLNSQTLLAMESERNLRSRLNDVMVQLEVIRMVSKLNAQNIKKFDIIPANLGVDDDNLRFIIEQYNVLVVERNRLIANSSPNNPRVLNMNTQMEDRIKSIGLTVSNLERVYTLRKRELLNLLAANKAEMENIPHQQFQLQQLERRIDVLKPLFLLLQQKREEAQIAMYSQIDKFFIIEYAFGSRAPVTPHSTKALIIAFLIGLCIAPGFAFFRSQLRTKIETKEDVTSKTDSPVIAVLPKSDKVRDGLLPTRSRDSCSEAFSLLRTNLQYIPDAEVIQVTSSIPDEGKTFTAVNLALSLAYVGKKTALLGFDLRKPTLAKIFKKKDIETNKTIVGYLLGRTDNPQDIVLPSDIDSNLDIAICGPTPHNPLNLMAKADMGKLIAFFRKNYDYVIVDSAPYFPVADASVVNKYVDSTLFVIRANYSELRLLEDINKALESPTRPIRNVNLVLNGFDAKKAYYSYGYSRKYGYVYGYGSGYGDNPKSNDKTEKN